MTELRIRDIPIEGDSYVLGEVIDFQTALPVEVCDGCMIERASPATQSFLSQLVDSLLFLGGNPFELERDPETKKVTPLPQVDWRYFILRHADEYIPVAVLKAAALIEPSVYLGPRFSNVRGNRSVGSSPGIQNHYWSTHRWWNAGKSITDQTVSDWGTIAKQLALVEAEYPEIGRSVHMFWILGGNDPSVDRLTILGYFIVIESLLTHRPDPKDPTDSIGRQIRSKMRLLGNRMASPLNYQVFGDTDVAKIWPALYDYRSVLAHGGSPDFGSGKLSRLKDEETVITFLQTACRRLLCQAVEEPLLFLDLKEC